MRKFGSVNELVNTLNPEHPVYCIRPNSVKKSVEFFKNNFPHLNFIIQKIQNLYALNF